MRKVVELDEVEELRQVYDIIWNAEDVLDIGGWMKREEGPEDYDNAPHCITGALGRAQRRLGLEDSYNINASVQTLIENVIREHTAYGASRRTRICRMVAFNDYRPTQERHVRRVLALARQRAELDLKEAQNSI